MLIDLLGQAIARNPIRSQREACTVTARRSIAALGPVHSDAGIRETCIALAGGLFGDYYSDAPETEQDLLIALMEEEYRKCLKAHTSMRK